MSSATPRICDELRQSSLFKNKLAISILKSDAKTFGICRGSLYDHLRDAIYEKLNVRVNKFLEKYENMIKNVSNNRRYYLGDESRDCEQFIRMSLCKLYKKRYAYTNFDKVVKSAIKRKAIDFSKSRNSSMKMTISESDFMAMIDNEKTGEDIGLYRDEISCETPMHHDCLSAVHKLRRMVLEDRRKVFTEWDKRLMNIVCDNINRGVVDIPDMFNNLEYDKNELMFRMRVLSKKLRETFDMRQFL